MSSSKSKPTARISARALPSPDDSSDSELELELDPVQEQSDAVSPDSPLLAPTVTQPRWLQLQHPKWLRAHRNGRFTRWWRRILASLAAFLRPRRSCPSCPSWPVAALVVVAAYALLCFVRGVPLLASPLPPYSGPYGVGAVDVEVALDKPRRVSETVFKSTGEPAFEHRTTLFTVYYPVDKSVKERRRRHDWFARPIGLTAAGYAKYAHVNNFLMRPIFTFGLWLVAGGITIPAKVDAPLLGTTAAEAEVEWSDGELPKLELRKRDEEEVEQLPVMVFSHGDASSRRDYTHYIGELASRGYVVAAIEHRDGSCPGTLMRIKGEQDKQLLHFKEAELLSDPPMDTEKYKREQLAFRDAEILETINILRAINNGHGDDIFTRNSRSEGSHLHSWANRLDFGNLTIGGHSFGATGALQALKHAPSDVNPAIGGIILDPGKQSGPLNALIDVPLLIVHSNSWSKQRSVFYNRPHFDTVKDLALSVLKRIPSHSSWFLTSIGTSHPSVSDAPLIEPLLLSWTTGASLNVKEALGEYVRVTDDFWHFLRTTRSANSSLTDGVVRRGEMKGILAEKVTHEEYDDWVSKERQAEFPKSLSRLWQVHVSPVSDKDE
ncbi:hypothetical protein TGAMA5MH_03227 [Trichoderma gamsii]|uniref:Putative phospholipase n=1 Tax=Trichoderma gamsii TaxID=398673 RepID=A0A2K0TI14_9HYPO|nr:hypothetical protein TGAMA5MH_03227 [Trichoderma gamsii]